MNISEAIEEMRAGHALARDGWNGKGQYIQLQVPDVHSKMSLPYIFICTVDKKFVPWLASQTDILADDWQIYTS